MCPPCGCSSLKIKISVPSGRIHNDVRALFLLEDVVVEEVDLVRGLFCITCNDSAIVVHVCLLISMALLSCINFNNLTYGCVHLGCRDRKVNLLFRKKR